MRLAGAATEPGGKGVNVARAVAAAGASVVTVLPAAGHDPIVHALEEIGLPLATVPVATPVRTNYTLADPDGTTTKLNEPGAALDGPTRQALAAVLLEHAAAARWVALSGSLPPGTPVDWYAELVAVLRSTGARIAVDTSGAPLRALLDAGTGAAPWSADSSPAGLQVSAASRPGDAAAAGPEEAAEEGGHEQERPRRHARGDGHAAAGRRIAVRSTVGAGDCSLAGYLLADLAGDAPAERLRSAVAYGAASAALPGSAVPSPADLDRPGVRITAGFPGPTALSTPAPPGTTVPAAGRDAR